MTHHLTAHQLSFVCSALLPTINFTRANRGRQQQREHAENSCYSMSAFIKMFQWHSAVVVKRGVRLFKTHWLCASRVKSCWNECIDDYLLYLVHLSGALGDGVSRTFFDLRTPRIWVISTKSISVSRIGAERDGEVFESCVTKKRLNFNLHGTRLYSTGTRVNSEACRLDGDLLCTHLTKHYTQVNFLSAFHNSVAEREAKLSNGIIDLGDFCGQLYRCVWMTCSQPIRTYTLGNRWAHPRRPIYERCAWQIENRDSS